MELNTLGILAVAAFGIFLSACACCGAQCNLCSDSFAYTAGEDTDVDGLSSCGWTEITGAWSIKTNRLKVSGTAFSIIRNDTTHTNEQLGVTVKPSSPSGYGRWRIIFDYNSTTDHAWAELKLEATGSTLSVGQNIAGTDTTHESVSTSASPGGTFTACITDGGHIRASWPSTTGTRVDEAVLPGFPMTTGTAGLGSGNSTTEIWFTDFALSKVEPSNDCPACLPACLDTACPDQDNVPLTLTLVVAGTANTACLSCTTLNGTFILTNTGTGCIWTYTFPAAICTYTMAYNVTVSNLFGNRGATFNLSGTVGGLTSVHWRAQTAFSPTGPQIPDDCDAPYPAFSAITNISLLCNTAATTIDI